MMNDNLLAMWKYRSISDDTTQVFPDGCQDLIVKTVDGKQPHWFVTPLYNQTKSKLLETGTTMTGFRMKPGVRIKEQFFLDSVSNELINSNEIFNRLDDFTHLNNNVDEALEYLASDVKSVVNAANEIGVSVRALQRLLISETNRPPIFWLMLARVRRTARSLIEPIPLVEIANNFGYSDQAHMSREFKRWFNISPSALRNSPDILSQLTNSGYD